MYKVNDKEFISLIDAVIFATSIDSNVINVTTGLEIWRTSKDRNITVVEYYNRKKPYNLFICSNNKG